MITIKELKLIISVKKKEIKHQKQCLKEFERWLKEKQKKVKR